MDYLSVVYAKYSVFIFNLLFALTGAITLVASTLIYLEYQRYEHLIGDHFWSAAAFLICTGCFVFLIAFLCSCGAVKENSQIILSFLFLLMLIFSFEIGASVVIYNKRNQLNATLSNSFNQMLINYTSNEENWTVVQTQLKCCGVNGPDDWIQRLNSTNLPESCCPSLQISNATTDCTKEIASKNGCKPLLLAHLKHLTTLLAGVGIGIGWTQMVVVGYACCLYFVFRKNYAQFTERLL